MQSQDGTYRLVEVSRPGQRRTGSERSGGSGPRRNQESTDAILDATMALLGEVGYLRLTMEGVAARAGVGKATVYRWWPSKGALVLDAMASRLEMGPAPDTGDLRGNLLAAAASTVTTFTATAGGVVVAALAAEMATDPALSEMFRERFVLPRRRAMTEMLARARDDGELRSDVRLDVLLDTLVGTIFYRALISREPVDEHLAQDVVDLLLQGARPASDDPADA